MTARIHSRLPTDCTLPDRLDFVGLYYDGEGYRVRVAEFAVGSPSRFEINFGAGPLAQRSMDEGSYLATTWTVDESSAPPGPVVLVTNSDFLDWFHEQSCGIYPRDKVKHVAVLTQNEWIEVLCLELPRVYRLPSLSCA